MHELLRIETLMALCLGVGLAAAAGFRVFLPPLVLGIAQRLDAPLTDAVPDWVGSWPALIVTASAALIEISAYYLPWLDNALDTVATPLAVIAGILLAGLALGDLPPLYGWTLAVIAGGSAAGVTQAASVMTRLLSTGATGGLGNFLVSTGEALLSLLVAVLAVLIAPAVLVALALALVWLFRLLRRRRAAVRAT